MEKLEALNQALEKLLKNKNFIELENAVRKDATLFDIFSIYSENRVSEFLAWLLAPYEFHGLGTEFLGEMIKNCGVNRRTCTVFSGDPLTKRHAKKNDFIRKFKTDTIVQCEYRVLPKSRIDIAVINPVEKVAIFIEIKVFAKEKNKQTKKYASQLLKQFKDYTVAFVFIDDNGSKAASDKFYSLDFKWVEDFVQNKIKDDKVSPNAKRAMSAFETNFWGEVKGTARKAIKAILNDDEFLELLNSLYKIDQSPGQIYHRFENPYNENKGYCKLDVILYQHWLALWYLWVNKEKLIT